MSAPEIPTGDQVRVAAAALISARLLKPLGTPAPNGTKFFATIDILEFLEDRSWLTRMTNTINQHWQRQNARKKNHSVNGFCRVSDASGQETRNDAMAGVKLEF